jgi:hypothetical protein
MGGGKEINEICGHEKNIIPIGVRNMTMG